VAKSPYFWREIDLSWRPVVTDHMLRYVVEHISATSLSLRGTGPRSPLPHAGHSCPVSHVSHTHTHSPTGCQYLTDQALQCLAKCHKLTQLNMYARVRLHDQ
jgi:hypothetical protein